MREALHAIDNDLYKLPYSATKEEVNNFKKLADKDLFQCPHCKAILRVKYGNTRGLYFSHQHSEACEESTRIDHAEKRYRKQIERETRIHNTIQAILLDEISNQAKNNPLIKVDYGFWAKSDLKEYPDIWVKVADREFALSIVTNVNSIVDSKLSTTISKRHQYFLEQGMEPIWFVEKKEQAIEKEKNSIILWDAELTIAAKTKEDKKWDSIVDDLVQDHMFFKYFHYPVSTDNLSIDVRSMYYIYSNDERIVVKVQRFLKDRIAKPYRSFLLGDGYEIPFADAVLIKNELLLSNPELENQYQNEFIQKSKQLQFAFKEQQRIEKERKQHEEKAKQKLMQEMLQQEQERRKNFLEQISSQKTKGNQEPIRVSSYEDLKILLKRHTGMTQRQQMELWTNYMPKIGLKNSSLVWDLFQEYNCNSFDELRTVLQNFISQRNK